MTKSLQTSKKEKHLTIPRPASQESPTSYAARLCSWYRDSFHQNSTSQVFTPPIVAKFMARKCISSKKKLHILDPGVGIGILSSAIIEAFSERHNSGTLFIDAIDIDKDVIPLTKRCLDYATTWAANNGISVTCTISERDFLSMGIFKKDDLQQELQPESEVTKYDVVVMNPPYSKIASSDTRVTRISEVIGMQPNTYSLFLSIALSLLKSKGKLVSINPRSFASGRYYQDFRKYFFNGARLREIHLFNSRRNVFPDDGILQEILIMVAETGSRFEFIKNLLISSSECIEDLEEAKPIKVPLDTSISHSEDKRLVLPTTKDDIALLKRINRWKERLSSIGLEISTGPVVPFRTRKFLRKRPSTKVNLIPLLWMNNISKMNIEWPQKNGKPEYFVNDDKSKRYTVPSNRFVLLRRFSAKEEHRRLTAAVVTDDLMKYSRIGIENHVNYIHNKSKGLENDLAYGLAGLLNSSTMDRYFRIINGNTQVNVYDIELMPLPNKEQLKQIGSAYLSINKDVSQSIDMIDSIIEKVVNH